MRCANVAASGDMYQIKIWRNLPLRKATSKLIFLKTFRSCGEPLWRKCLHKDTSVSPMGTFTYYLLPIFRRGGFSLNDKLFFAIKEKSIGSKKITGKKKVHKDFAACGTSTRHNFLIICHRYISRIFLRSDIFSASSGTNGSAVGPKTKTYPMDLTAAGGRGRRCWPSKQRVMSLARARAGVSRHYRVRGWVILWAARWVSVTRAALVPSVPLAPLFTEPQSAEQAFV